MPFYVESSDFRKGADKWYTHGLELTVDDAGDNALSDAIRGQSDAIDLYTDDHFLPEPGDVPETTITIDVDGSGGPNLTIPKRIRSISSVALRDLNGDLTVQDPTVYRVIQSLSGGERNEADLDIIKLIPGKYLTGTGWWDDWAYPGAWTSWPIGVGTVQVAGQFSWATTPEQIKRAVALMVYDAIKPETDVLHRAATWTSGGIGGGTTFGLANTTPTGIPEVDRIIGQFTRNRIPSI